MRIIVDSCGWLEWFTNGILADKYEKYLADHENMMMPVIVLFEVYKVLKREVGEEKALIVAGYMKNSTVIPLDETLALSAADIALQESLAMADAIIVAAARAHSCKIITSDSDLKDQLYGVPAGTTAWPHRIVAGTNRPERPDRLLQLNASATRNA